MPDYRSFSERYGLKPKRIMQADDMSDDLRNSLYNNIFIHYLIPYRDIGGARCKTALASLVLLMWVNYLKQPLDERPTYWSEVCEMMKHQVTRGEYNEVYDLIEFIPNNFKGENIDKNEENKKFIATCNSVFEIELAPYRFVGKLITRLTSEHEIIEVEKALVSPLQTVKTHISRAHELLADKKSPDYRNSIKESISAVEAICQEIMGEKTTLGNALGRLSKMGIDLPESLKGAFEKLYGWSSSEDGIRHSLSAQSKVDHEDALWALVSCSAFVNYLVVKAGKTDIKFSSQK